MDKIHTQGDSNDRIPQLFNTWVSLESGKIFALFDQKNPVGNQSYPDDTPGSIHNPL